jgi:enamine deaminase RidA (YjgF/YER057c/UK114 family)
MSQALASARRRRAGPEPVTNNNNNFGNSRQTTPQPSFPTGGPQQQQQQQPNMSAGLTLTQVISVVDRRLITLETFMREQKEQAQMSVTAATASTDAVPAQVSEVLEEFNARFDIIADELASMKDMMLKLQSFTMEVNKTLMEERVRVLSSMTDMAMPRPPASASDETAQFAEFASASELESSLYASSN